MKSVSVGMVGCGVVGNGVWNQLQTHRDLLAARTGLQIEVARIAVRNPELKRDFPQTLFTTDWRQVVHDPTVQIVVELMGGTTTAREVARAAIEAGKPFITANKALLAEYGEELFILADKHKVPIYFEASVAGGIPIIKTLREGLRANRIRAMHGIINGTCNYILTRMSEEGRSFEEVLAEAKKLGYAEADESLDVDGIDAAHKVAVLASIAYGFWVHVDQVYVEGIRNISPLDIEQTRRFGYGVKLLAITRLNENETVEVRVHPTLIPLDHVLASVSGVYNAIAVEGDIVGRTLFYGRGAGANPTASAVLADLTEAALHLVNDVQLRSGMGYQLCGRLITIDDISTRYYVRFSVVDRPGVLGTIASIFGNHHIGISSVFQPEGHEGDTVPLIFLLDLAREADFRAAIQTIQKLDVIAAPACTIRMEDFK